MVFMDEGLIVEQGPRRVFHPGGRTKEFLARFCRYSEYVNIRTAGGGSQAMEH